MLGIASLGLGIASAALVFGIGLWALTGVTQKWVLLFGTPLFVCGGSSAFLGFLGATSVWPVCSAKTAPVPPPSSGLFWDWSASVSFSPSWHSPENSRPQ